LEGGCSNEGRRKCVTYTAKFERILANLSYRRGRRWDRASGDVGDKHDSIILQLRAVYSETSRHTSTWCENPKNDNKPEQQPTATTKI